MLLTSVVSGAFLVLVLALTGCGGDGSDGAGAEDVKELDLGDDSYLSGTTLVVLDGDAEYTFTTVFGDSSEAIAGLKRLAKRVVGG